MDAVTGIDRSHSDGSNRPVIIMCPGVSGDNDKLAHFRTHFADDFQFVVPTYPDWHEIVREKASLALFIDGVVGQALPRLNERQIGLVGYSFGGLLAHEVACTLRELGHRIGVVCILDTDITFGPSSPAESKLARRSGKVVLRRDIAQHGIRKAVLMRLAYHIAVRVFRSSLLRTSVARCRPKLPLPADIAETFDHLLRLWIHEAVARAWRPRTQSVDTVVFRSKRQTSDLAPTDLGWSRYTNVVAIQEVGGSHHSMISGAHGKRLARLLHTTFATHL